MKDEFFSDETDGGWHSDSEIVSPRDAGDGNEVVRQKQSRLRQAVIEFLRRACQGRLVESDDLRPEEFSPHDILHLLATRSAAELLSLVAGSQIEAEELSAESRRLERPALSVLVDPESTPDDLALLARVGACLESLHQSGFDSEASPEKGRRLPARIMGRVLKSWSLLLRHDPDAAGVLGSLVAGIWLESVEIELPQPSHRSDSTIVSDSRMPPSASAATSQKQNANRFGNDFRVICKIGRGGMGDVFKCHQLSVNRVVALKVMRPDKIPSASLVRRFELESEIAARLEHAHILPVYEVGYLNDRPYYTMRYVDGQSLSDRVQTCALDCETSARYAHAVALALEEAHQNGILHRDVKPSNILVESSSDRAFIADFGLAKLVDDERLQMTMTGAVFGSPPFMSPEQALDSAKVTNVSDVYSLGATLYFTLTGSPPFHGAQFSDVIHQVLYEEPTPIAQLSKNVDRDLTTICMKCMEKEPSKRYGSAGELANELDRYLTGRAIDARPVGSMGRFVRWYRRYPSAAVITAGGYTLFTAGLMSLWAILGMFAFGFGVHGSQKAVPAIFQLAALVAVLYVPMFFVGMRTVRVQPIAVWAGAVFFFVGSLLALLLVFGNDLATRFIPAAFKQGDAAIPTDAKIRLWGLVAIIVLIGLLTHVVAIRNYYRFLRPGRDRSPPIADQ